MAEPAEFTVRKIGPGQFEPASHYYPRVLNAQIHPTVAHFFNLDRERILARYCHINPTVNRTRLRDLLAYQPRFLRWAGADLFYTATAQGTRHMVVLETNSCPSGQKSMPLLEANQEEGGYRTLIERNFLPSLLGKRLPAGGLAVLYDKNRMENSGYAATLAELTGEPVYLVPCHDQDKDRPCRFDDGVLHVRDAEGSWLPIRAAFRYVTQRPWNRIPVHTKTAVFNPIVTCLSGGRNKMLAAKAYELFNGYLAGSGLTIRTPETIWDVSLNEVPLWVRRLDGLAAVKVPYSNAGQGVYTITNERELREFMELPHGYDQFIVQSLIGNYNWAAHERGDRVFHIGTVPNKRGQSYVADVRVMVSTEECGFRPLAVYARRARLPLADRLDHQIASWDMLGTNLSRRLPDGGWDTETERLLLMDNKDFSTLGIGIDDLIEAFVQTVLATVAIDRMACELTTRKGRFRSKLFASLDNDPALIQEVAL